MKRKNSKTILFSVNILVGLIIIFPLLYALSLSLMEAGQIIQYPPKLIPSKITFQNYKDAIESVPIIKFILNSFIVSIAVTIGQIITASLAAYAFAFFDFKGKGILFIIILATMMIPSEATIISNYLTVSALGWNDSFKVLIIPFLTSAMGIFLMRQYYLTIPRELKQAAQIDGCGNFRFLTRIVVPISTPAIASLGIYVFINTWNQYMWPLLTINDPQKRTVQIGISMLQYSEATNYGIVLAGAVLILVPSIFVFIIGQKALVRGMTAGAIKG
jgi:sn-glycerol 3-phosphate transport system permease protein